MSTASTMDRLAAGSPRSKARLAGLFYLLTILGGVWAQGFVSDRLVDYHDAAVTASNIVAHEGLFRLSFAVFLVEMASQVALTSLFYELLAPVSRSVSLLAAYLGLTGCIVKTFARVFYVVPLYLLGPHHPPVFDAQQ